VVKNQSLYDEETGQFGGPLSRCALDSKYKSRGDPEEVPEVAKPQTTAGQSIYKEVPDNHLTSFGAQS